MMNTSRPRNAIMQAIMEDQRRRRQEPRRNVKESNVEEIRLPLSIIEVVREGSSNFRELLELCYSPDNLKRKWSCTFCGSDMEDHSLFSFTSKENGVAIPRWLPGHCTLHILLDKIAQDFFPGSRTSLNTKQSHLNGNIRFVFDEVDEFSTRVSTTWLDFQKQKLEKPSFRALSIEQQLDALNRWIKNCNENHQLCKRKSDLGIPAKRVLDLGSVATNAVHLVEASSLKGRYVALSHCWGDPKRHPLKSTHATLKDHMSGIAISSLPRSFRDLIRVCLNFKIQYLWIDCLCIVQDDEIEWLAEAEKMADIYEKSYLTVAASRALNSQHGFLFDFQDDTINYKIVVEAPWKTEISEYQTFHATFQINHKTSKSDSTPLNSRAWCLQEWYLPTRLIEFSLHDLRFLCLQAAETRFGSTNDKGVWSRVVFRGFGRNDAELFQNLWKEIREDYFGRNLTKRSDLLPAMAGLAKQFEGLISNNKYLAGLWEKSLVEDLSWTVLDFDAEMLPVEGVPSWSWASITAPRGYIYGKPHETFAELVESHCTGYARPEAPASLTLRGFLAPLFMRVDYSLHNGQGRPDVTFWIDEDSVLNATIEDIKESRSSRSRSYCVLDMLIGPVSHNHKAMDTNHSGTFRVPSIIRDVETQQTCKLCKERGYVSPVTLLLLTRTDVSLTALVLTPVTPRSGDEDVYQRLGLLEIDCIRESPVFETSDGDCIPVEDFFEIDDPYAREMVTII